jgi:hypothetical protein
VDAVEIQEPGGLADVDLVQGDVAVRECGSSVFRRVRLARMASATRTGRAEILEFGSDRRKPRRMLLARGFYGSSLESDPRELASAGQAGARRESRPLAPGYFAMRSK